MFGNINWEENETDVRRLFQLVDALIGNDCAIHLRTFNQEIQLQVYVFIKDTIVVLPMKLEQDVALNTFCHIVTLSLLNWTCLKTLEL